MTRSHFATRFAARAPQTLAYTMTETDTTTVVETNDVNAAYDLASDLYNRYWVGGWDGEAYTLAVPQPEGGRREVRVMPMR
jgi:hypothetical protein